VGGEEVEKSAKIPKLRQLFFCGHELAPNMLSVLPTTILHMFDNMMANRDWAILKGMLNLSVSTPGHASIAEKLPVDMHSRSALPSSVIMCHVEYTHAWVESLIGEANEVWESWLVELCKKKAPFPPSLGSSSIARLQASGFEGHEWY